MRGFPNVFSTVGMESLVGSREWFSLALCPNNFSVSALGQTALDGKGAHLNWLLPTEKTGSDPLPELLDHIATEAGLRGARYITAAARVDDCLFETLRRAGYCVYSWQSVWSIRLLKKGIPNNDEFLWRETDREDALAIETLQRRLYAPAVQSVTEFAGSRLPGFILERENKILGFAFVESFNGKVLVKPFINKDLDNPGDMINGLINGFFSEAKSVFLVQTSDQRWLTDAIQEIGVQIYPREELLVKHFAAVEKAPVASLNHTRNGRRTDTVTPMMPSAEHGDNL